MQRDKAKAEYIRRRAVGENINLKEFAGEMGANYESLRRWKVRTAGKKGRCQKARRAAGKHEQQEKKRKGK